MKQARPKRTWHFFPEDSSRQLQLAQELKISSILAKCLLNRSLQDPAAARNYLQPEMGQLVDPFAFRQMGAAVERIRQALANKERILVHGDYDVDGVSGTVLLLQLFRLLGADVCAHIPNRLKDGYSFGPASLEKIAKEKATLVVTIDNGITAVGPITELKRRGVDVLITDHHRPSEHEPLPPAVAILNPNLSDSGYPHGNLCGVAVAFKLAWGIAQGLSPNRRASPQLRDFLVEAMGLVAIGTISDIVPLLGENRVFAKFGLAALQQSKRPGMRALLRMAGLEGKRLRAEDVGFGLGPRINAAGRLGAAEKAVELLTTDDVARAEALAFELEANNEERKEIQRRIFEEARERVRASWDFSRHPVIVLADDSWHAGIVGIVCSKLVEEFHAPTLLIAMEGEEGRGSARAMDGFELHKALSACAPLLTKFGGHAQAAGMEIRREKFEEFVGAINAKAREMLAGGLPPARIAIDAEISLGGVHRGLLEEVGKLAPFGPFNGEPVFATRRVQVAAPPRRVGKFGEHLQFQVQQGTSLAKAIAFGMGERESELARGGSISLAYTPKLNAWNGRETIDLEIRDFLVEE